MGRTNTPAVAVVGMSCRAPGAATYVDLWSLLLRGGVSCGPWPASRRCLSGVWTADALDERLRERLPGLMAGGYLEDVAAFDADLFGISTREAVAMDPQHRLLLEAAWAAVQDAAIDPRSLAHSSTGVYVGLSSMDYGLLAHEGSVQAGPYGAIGGSRSLGANRISHALGLEGPSISVDAACASSLVCIHLAARALAGGDCDLAIAGGANLILSPSVNVNFSRARMLSSDGRCHPFQKHATGYARSEGVGAVVLKRLDDAQRDGDPVRAVVFGSAVNQDGRTPGITVPSASAQIDVIRRAWAEAGITADDPDIIEGHGTGTPVGDPIELAALAAILADRDAALPPCLVGSLKANIGHTEAAAGLVSFIKAVRVLETGHVPPLVVEGELLAVPGDARGRLAFPRARAELGRPRDRIACAGVSAFGFGGTNCHVVLKAAAAPAPRADAPHGPVLVTLSAATRDALDAMTETWARRLAEMSPWDFADAGHTSNAAYSGEAERLWIVADTPHEAAALLGARVSSAGPARACDPLAGFGERWAAGGEVALEPLAAPGSRLAGGMPAYPFHGRRFWLSHAPCPGERRDDDAQAGTDGCTIDVSFAALPYLRDHRIDRTIVAPGATLVDLALTHARERFGETAYVVENVVFHAPLVLDDALSGSVRLHFSPSPAGRQDSRPRIAFEFWHPGANGRRQDHLVASGLLAAAPEMTA